MITKRKVSQAPPWRVPASLAYRVSSLVALAGLVLAGFGLPAQRGAHRSLLAGATPAASVTTAGYLTQVTGSPFNFGANTSVYTPVVSTSGAGVFDFTAQTALFSFVQSSSGGIATEGGSADITANTAYSPTFDTATAIAVSPSAISGDYVVAVATAAQGGAQGDIDIFTETPAGVLTAVGGPYSPVTGGLGTITALAFSPISFGNYNPDGFVLAAADSQGIQTFSVNTGGITLLNAYNSSTSIAGPTTGQGLAFSPNGTFLAVAVQNLSNQAGNGYMQFFTVGNGGALSDYQVVNVAGQPTSVAFNPSGIVLAVAEPSVDGLSILSEQQSNWGNITDFGLSAPTESVAFSPDGNLLAVGLNNNTVQLFDGSFTGATLSQVSGSPFPTGGVTPNDMGFSPSGDYLQMSAAGGNGPAVFSVARSTSISLGSTANPSVYGQAVNFTATVAPSDTTVPAPSVGTVQFYIDSNAVGGPVGVSGGTATLSGVSDLSVGSHTVTAVYSGDENSGGVSYEGSSTSTTQQVNQTVNQASTSTSLRLSTSSAYYGQAVSFVTSVTANSPGSGTPTGTVNLTIPDLPTAPSTGLSAALSSGGFTFGPYTSLTVGQARISASYGGDNDFQASTSSGQTITISSDPTTTAITSSPSSSVYGQTDTFNVAVTPVTEGQGFSTNGNEPQGTVTLYAAPNGGQATQVGSGTLSSSGDAVISTASLPVGSDTVTAAFAPASSDDLFAASTTTAPASVKVGQDTVTLGLLSSANPSVFGQGVSFTATVAAASPGSGTPSGTVQFAVDGSDLGSPVTLSSGSATSVAVSNLSVADHTVTASYSGDTNFSASSASSAQQVDQKVGQASVTTAVAANPGTSVYGSAVTLSATVTATSPGAGTPTGTVTFEANGNPVGTPATLTNGAASESVTVLPGGSDSITASYSGDSNFAASTATEQKPLSFTVTPAATSVAVKSSANPAVYGQPVVFTATVSTSASGAGTPEGQVQFYVSGSAVGSPVTLSGGVASTPGLSTLAAGSDTVTASYTGDSDFAASSAAGGSGVVTETVNQAPAKVTVSGPAQVSAGQPATFQVTVSGGDPPTGAVVFTAGSTNLGSAPLNSAGQASFTTTALPPGNVTVAVAYSGDPNFQQATATTAVSVSGGSGGGSPAPADTNAQPASASLTGSSTSPSTPSSSSGSTGSPSSATTGNSSASGGTSASSGGSSGAATSGGSSGAATPTGSPGTGGTPPKRSTWPLQVGGALILLGLLGIAATAEASRRHRAYSA